MAQPRSLIDENAQSKFGLKSIEALFRNSKQDTKRKKHDNDEFKIANLRKLFPMQPKFRLEQIK